MSSLCNCKTIPNRRESKAPPRRARQAAPHAFAPRVRPAVARRFPLAVILLLLALPSAARADRVQLVDGTAIEADAVWEDAQGVWYRRGGVTYLIERARVRAVERDEKAKEGERARAEEESGKSSANKSPAKKSKETGTKALVKVVEEQAATASVEKSPNAEALPFVLIHLVGGARMEVDEANETAEGVWYRRGNLSNFIERARVERVERERPEEVAEANDPKMRRARRERFWTTGSVRLDSIIRQNGTAFGVDPYLIFCVMEQESQFNSRAVSPKGARGLMQLMPGTAARFGVRNPHDPAQSIRGGTRYLKQLLQRFGGRVDLTLASYNAGEGAVLKYGQRIPPYRETRAYVRRISARYRQGM